MKKVVENTRINPLTSIFPIGAICNKEVYKIITGMTNFKEFIPENQRQDINNFRTFLNDGNGFYRAVMFTYFETRILTKNVFDLKKFIFDAHETIVNPLRRKNFIVNKHDFLGVFHIIVEYLESDRLDLAYSFFIKAYFAYDWFDKVTT